MFSYASLLLMMMASGGAAPLEREAPLAGTGQFIKRELVHGGQTHRYQVFVPAGHGHGHAGPLPVILFLHGSGERGSDGEKQIQSGLGPYLQEKLADFPALVVFPQSPEGKSWDGSTAEVALAALDETVASFDADRKRVYLTGLSRGGYGTYSIAMAHPQRFAALVPICGGITSPRLQEPLQVEAVAAQPDPFDAAARRLRHIPTWIFHGAKDDLVPPQQSRRMYAALQAADGDARYTEFPEAGHNSWDAAYRHDPMWSWLFAQRLP